MNILFFVGFKKRCKLFPDLFYPARDGIMGSIPKLVRDLPLSIAAFQHGIDLFLGLVEGIDELLADKLVLKLQLLVAVLKEVLRRFYLQATGIVLVIVILYYFTEKEGSSESRFAVRPLLLEIEGVYVTWNCLVKILMSGIFL